MKKIDIISKIFIVIFYLILLLDITGEILINHIPDSKFVIFLHNCFNWSKTSYLIYALAVLAIIQFMEIEYLKKRIKALEEKQNP